MCLTKESSVTQSNRGSKRDRNAGSKAIQSDVIWYVLALILLQGYKGFVKAWKSRDDASLLLIRVLNVLHHIVLLLLFTARHPLLFSFFLLFLLALLSLDSSCVCRQPTKREPSANSCCRRCRHAVAIGLKLRLLQLIARHCHYQKVSTSTCFPYHTTRQSHTHVYACGYT